MGICTPWEFILKYTPKYKNKREAFASLLFLVRMGPELSNPTVRWTYRTVSVGEGLDPPFDFAGQNQIAARQ